ncbi:MAG: efflux RND transporter permease subunit [Magnetospirillum sp.]|uniref:Cobalt-zinc-cadmium resistance protein CzcA Cation efflux system protein CusA n=1 Tax=Paramagnetospirillum magnetotacticum MS-1 TaxID=272627 RepID=A0A0C2UC93_PARME|nr:CusA/CzcA family heavy metal efflux RND transporter [Paramagnetospirillum magnetotacticum]KIL99092.1 Cobalt-zinc-cadmium resistance protein CzcA Cation efflux system protein CusA [Paramagnetospirillum magnetotacticum MS-1]MBI3445657.1 efflux RND transporter permease subunit [Magnetospirillum sp.]
MINTIIERALQRRFLVILAALAVFAFGIWTTFRLNLDAFPDVTNIQVQINTESPGLAAAEVERLVTFPVESVMNGIPGVTQVRSISKTGLSVVTVVFEDNVDTYFARQLVLEKLQTAKERIPNKLGSPELGPITTGLGQVYKYLLTSPTHSAMELREINDWQVKFQLRTVPGVTDVLSFGGSVRQYQVQVDPNRLVSYDLTLDDLKKALQSNNANAGGWYIEGAQEQLSVRGEGLVSGGPEGLADIESVVLKSVDGTPVFVRDVAKVEYGSEIRQGAVSMNGNGEAVMGVVLQLKGANTNTVIQGIRAKLSSVQASLPPDVKIEPVYDQSALILKAVGTVQKALAEAAILIVIVLFLFLWNIRSALVVLVSIPLSMLVAVIMMRWAGLSANLQSLGGLAIAIGMMVDGSLVMVENIVRHLAEPHYRDRSLPWRVAQAAREVGNPVFFAVLIIIVVFLPLFTLQGVEGKLFSPMAFVIAFAMLGSLVVALTIVPVLASLALSPNQSDEDSFLMRAVRRAYTPALAFALRRRVLVVGYAAGALVISGFLLTRLGTEFVPELDEGTLSVRITMNPSISLAESLKIAHRLERRLLSNPDVTSAISQIGRPELGGDPEAVNNNEIWVGLKPQSEWTSAGSRAELVANINKELAEYPGVAINISQPIANRVDELLSGVKAQIAIKLFGGDLRVLEEKGREIEEIVKAIDGAANVQAEQISGEAQLVVRANRAELARYGLNVADVMDVVSTAIGGEAVTNVLDGQRRFAVYLRVAEPFRSDMAAIGELWVVNKDGVRVPLSQVSDISLVEGPPSINREDAQRRTVIQANVRGRDMGGFVAEAQAAVAQKVQLPPGYVVTWGGQFENQQRAQRTLMIVVPVCLGLIFLLLYFSFGSMANAALIILNVPFALIGGVFALWVSGQFLSVPSSVGFIALFGVAVLNGVVMVSYFDQLIREGRTAAEAVVEGAMLRLRPVLMTATVASLGLIPLLLSNGIGSEVQKPLATVVVGGLITSTLLTLLVLPVLYGWLAEWRKRNEQRALELQAPHGLR